MTNPAGRLYAVLQKARTAQPNPQAQAVEMWTAVLDMPNTDLTDLLRALLDLDAQMRRVRTQISTLPADADPDIALAHIDEVEAVLQRLPLLNGQTMEWTLAGLTNAGMLSLRACASLLDRYHLEPVLADERLTELRREVDSLIEEVRQSDDLDDQTRKFILSLLLKIKHSLERYVILGTGPVEAATNETVGALSRHSETLMKISKSKVAQGFLTLVLALDTTLNMAANARAIEPGSEPSPSRVIVEILEQCGVPLELPPGTWQPGAGPPTGTGK
jgi:hypothetical protein